MVQVFIQYILLTFVKSDVFILSLILRMLDTEFQVDNFFFFSFKTQKMLYSLWPTVFLVRGIGYHL